MDVAINIQSRVGYLHLLRPFLYKVSAGSPLQLALSALAVNFTYSAFGQSLNSNLPCTFVSQALLATQSVVKDPLLSLSDETLVTVFLLGACNMLSQGVMSPPPSGEHKSGALALIKARGSGNLESELARALLTGIRQHTIKLSLWRGDEMPMDPALWSNVGTISEPSTTILDTYAARLANLKAKMTFM